MNCTRFAPAGPTCCGRRTYRGPLSCARNVASGISEDYATKQMTATHTTSWSWNDATRTLSWAVQGSFSAGANLYTSVKPVLFTRGAAGPQHAATRPLTLAGGSVTFK